MELLQNSKASIETKQVVIIIRIRTVYRYASARIILVVLQQLAIPFSVSETKIM